MRGICLALAAAGLCLDPAAAQSQASPRVALPLVAPARPVAELFEQAVTRVCVPAVSQGVRAAQLPAAARADFRIVRETDARSRAAVRPEEALWRADGPGGVVLIREMFGRCRVEARGAPAGATLLAVSQGLAQGGAGFERLMASPGKMGLGQSLVRREGRRRVQVLMDGSEGAAGSQPVLTATVFAAAEP
jgi:hypothetical protein